MTARRIFAIACAMGVIWFGIWLGRPRVMRVVPAAKEAPRPRAAKEGVLPPPARLAATPPIMLPVTEKKKAVPAPAPKPAVPIAPAAVPAAMPAPAPKPAALPEAPIVMQSVIAVKCSFADSAGNAITAFGSGVIVTEGGYVLTARHVVDMDYTFRISGGKQGRAGYRLDACAVGGPGEGAHAPSIAEIRAINPFTEVASLPYRAEIALVPAAKGGTGLSEAEADFMDIAVLKITGPTADAAKFFGATMPASFPKSDIATDAMPGAGEQIVTFGFPSGAPSYGSSFRLQGSVGSVGQYIVGDLLFNSEPLGMQADMETIGGRSGSPVFWRGRVVGIVSAKRDYSTDATVISVYPLRKLLEGSGIAIGGL